MNKYLLLSVLIVSTLSAAPSGTEVAIVKHEVVVAGHPEAADAGMQVLHMGGNAMDAAVAVSLSLGVAEPYASGLGGKIEILYYEASSKKVYVVDGMDMSSKTLPVKAFINQPTRERIEGGPSAAVPGLAQGLYQAHKMWGILNWDQDVKPSILLAQNGSLILAKSQQLIEESSARIKHSKEGARIFLPNGKLPAVGSRLINTDLANTLQRLAAEGPDAIYKGRIAESIVDAVTKSGGYMTLSDLASYKARILEPVSVPYRDGRLFSTAPVSGGGQLLSVVSVLDNNNWRGSTFHDALSIDRFGKVFLTTIQKFDSITGDDETVDSRFKEALSEKGLESIRELSKLPNSSDKSSITNGKESTTHFIVVDSKHNIACVTQSLSYHFGCGIVPVGTGIVMNNSLSNFSIKTPGKPNYVAPGRRPKSTIAPTIWLNDKNMPILAIGLPGGARIPSGIAQVLLDFSQFHRPLAEAIADTRIHIANLNKEPTVECEIGLAESEVNKLKSLGWKVVMPEKSGTGVMFGGVNAVEFLSDGTLNAVADLRRTNSAKGD